MFFYDKWVAHDADGNAFKNEFPYVSHLYSQVCRHGPKRYLGPLDIVLNITQLLGTFSQKIIILYLKSP
jgi:hypothetical protein